MMELRQFFFTYNAAEDRVRLVGKNVQGESIVLWLTQRLLNRLMPAFDDWLAGQPGRVRSLEAAPLPPAEGGSVAAHSAAGVRDGLPQPEPVQVCADVPAWRVDSVTLRRGAAQIEAIFQCDGVAVAVIVLNEATLRQCMDLLQRACQVAEWGAAGSVATRLNQDEHTVVRLRPEGTVLH